MSFIAKHITHHDERLIYLARLHWIYLVKGLAWLLILGGLGVYLNWKLIFALNELPSASAPFIPYPFSILVDLAPGLIPSCLGLFMFLVHLFKMMGSEIALTNKRLIYKTGVFFVQSSEVELSEVQEERVDNGWFGAFIGYGMITLDCRFVGDFILPTISKPYLLLRQIHKLTSGEGEKAIATVLKEEPPVIPQGA